MTSYEMEPYLALELNTLIKSSFSRFRPGTSNIVVHTMRYRDCGASELICIFCKVCVANED